MLGYKPASTPMESKKKLRREEEGVPLDKGRYQHLVQRHLVQRLIFLSYIRPNIGFVVSL